MIPDASNDVSQQINRPVSQKPIVTQHPIQPTEQIQCTRYNVGSGKTLHRITAVSWDLLPTCIIAATNLFEDRFFLLIQRFRCSLLRIWRRTVFHWRYTLRAGTNGLCWRAKGLLESEVVTVGSKMIGIFGCFLRSSKIGQIVEDN